jgi:hypothetical protein
MNFLLKIVSKKFVHNHVCLFVAQSRKILPGQGNVCILYQLLAQSLKYRSYISIWTVIAEDRISALLVIIRKPSAITTLRSRDNNIRETLQ